MGQEHRRTDRAVMYLWVARAQNDSDTAIVAQRAACEHIAQRYGVTIVREYIDVGNPARLTQPNELQRLLTDLEQLRDAAYVVVSDYARLGPDFQSLDDVIRRIQACGTEVATITGVETAERFARMQLLDQVAEWATHPTEGDRAAPRHLTANDELSMAVQNIRSGQLDANQREALAVLVNIAGNATLPTPVAAAVFNVVEACKRSVPAKETTIE